MTSATGGIHQQVSHIKASHEEEESSFSGEKGGHHDRPSLRVEENGLRYCELPGGETISYTAEDERRVRRKLDWNMVTLIFVVETLAYVDRSNFGNAKTAGMAKEVGLSSAQYTWLLQMYYICYLSFQFLLMGWKIVPPNVYVSICALGWGTVSMVQAGADSWAKLMVCRAFMGFFEAGFIPGVALYMSFFYTRSEIGLRYGIFISTAAAAGIYAGALSYGLVQAHTSLPPWKLLLLVEGIPTIVIVPFIYFFLPAAPGKCRFLSEKDNAIAKHRLQRVEAGSQGREQGIKWAEVAKSFKDPIAYLYAAMIFCINMAFSSLPVFLPTILNDMGFTSIDAQGLSAPPYVAAFLACIFVLFASDRMKHRGGFLIAMSLLGALGYAVMGATENVGARYFATFLAATGLYTAVPVTFVWVMNNNADESRRGAGLTIFGTIGQTGPIAGLTLFPAEDAPRYFRGLFSSAGVLIAVAILAGIAMLYFRYENNRRDRIAEEARQQGVAEEDIPNKFRFIL